MNTASNCAQIVKIVTRQDLISTHLCGLLCSLCCVRALLLNSCCYCCCCRHGQKLMIQKELIEPPTGLYVKIHYPFTCQTLQLSRLLLLQKILAPSNLHTTQYVVNALVYKQSPTSSILHCSVFISTVQSRVLTRVTNQEINFL